MTNPTARAAPKSAKPQTPKFTAESIRKGRGYSPDRILLYGVEGIGKSSFASEAPKPIFIAAEEGIKHIDAPRFEGLTKFDDVLEVLRLLFSEDLGYQTLVIDTIGWVEHRIHEQARQEAGMSLEKWNAYGHGVKHAMSYHRRLLFALDEIQRRRAMEVILLAHAQVKNFPNPSGPDYNRYIPALQGDLTPDLYKQWADTVLFANYEDVVKESEGIGKAKGIETGRRLLHTTRTAAWDAKSRWNLPPEIEMPKDGSYAAYADARKTAGVYIERSAS
ncbi:MAG TPA: ATP-binding protein [Planctomycetota bacterium]|nr:ATP-binding protein [Planctomycetota bacterium]